MLSQYFCADFGAGDIEPTTTGERSCPGQDNAIRKIAIELHVHVSEAKILTALTSHSFEIDEPREAEVGHGGPSQGWLGRSGRWVGRRSMAKLCQVIGWALGMLLRRHLPTEKAVEVFSQEVPVLLSGEDVAFDPF